MRKLVFTFLCENTKFAEIQRPLKVPNPVNLWWACPGSNREPIDYESIATAN